jgi:hypothetical protein
MYTSLSLYLSISLALCLPAFQKCYEISLLQTPFTVAAEKAVSEKSFLPVSARKAISENSCFSSPSLGKMVQHSLLQKHSAKLLDLTC